MNHRPEIDGLRALAVVMVILFHGHVPGFSGGYLGVDVFFVISGFLITRLIREDLAHQRFSFRDFYLRRARRILPALLAVMVVTSIAAWFLLLPPDLRRYGQSLVASLAMLSNIYFLQASGYFNSAAEFQPLLHTWSLSVEEQFYLLAPMLLWWLGRRSLRKVRTTLSLLAVCSFGFCVWLARDQSAAAFFLLPARAWELALGGVLALRMREANLTVSAGPGQSSLAVGGLLLLAGTLVMIETGNLLPWMGSLLAVIATLLLLGGADDKTVVGRLLARPWLVWPGLLSYSAYLWHQPLFAFLRTRVEVEAGPPHFIALGLLAFLLAYPTWRWLEQPCRDARRVSVAVLLTGITAAILLLGAFGAASWMTRGFDSRLTAEQARFFDAYENSRPGWRYFERINAEEAFRFRCNFYDLERARAGQPSDVPRASLAPDCTQRRNPSAPTVLLWGDSHAQQLYPGLRAALPGEWNVLQVSTSNCALRGVNDFPNREKRYCEYSNAFAWQLIGDQRPQWVVIAQEVTAPPAAQRALIADLRAAGVATVVMAGPVPRWRADLPMLALNHLDQRDTVLRAGLDPQVLREDAQMKRELADVTGAVHVSAIDHFCQSGACRVFARKPGPVVPVAWDRAHLTPEASIEFAAQALVPRLLAAGGRFGERQ